MKIIVTGSTGMVGEGVLLECLESAEVEKVLSVSRKPTQHTHPKLEQLLVPDFRKLDGLDEKLTGYDACFYCAGISSAGMNEADYTVITYDTALAFATKLAQLNPNMVLTHISGAHTDGSEKGRVMWARVKGRAENALMKLPFKGVYNFRPGLMTPKPGQVHVKKLFRAALVLTPVFKLFFPALTLAQVGQAMLKCVKSGAPKQVLEVPDIAALVAA
ncbi:MAG: NAD-dependent epimerase/dehydratase family protein [Myxococcaceae bacterium]|nr:NAD-dependent epimerase/dehydratase family protein [Myxococcaceae bacterium]